MTEPLTADGARRVLKADRWPKAAYEGLCAIANGRHVAIPAEDYALLQDHSEAYADLHTRCFDGPSGDVFEAVAGLKGQLTTSAEELERLRKEAAVDSERATHYRDEWQKLRAERDRLAGINRELLDALTVLLMEAETFSVSGVYFTEPCMQHKGPVLAHAAIAAATK